MSSGQIVLLLISVVTTCNVKIKNAILVGDETFHSTFEDDKDDIQIYNTVHSIYPLLQLKRYFFAQS
jgi:hypothetical protein